MSDKPPLQIFAEEAPDVQQAYGAFIQSLIDMKGMDQKTKQLIYIGMKMITDDERAIQMHVAMAKKAGATRDEIKATIVLGLSVIGIKAAAKFLPVALNSYDSVS